MISISAAQACAAAGTSAAPGASMPGSPAAASGIPVAAVWREQRFNFLYLGRTSRYSCGGLRDKVRALLLDLGARRDLKIAATGCADYGRVSVDSATPHLTIDFSSPAIPDASMKPSHAGDLTATDARFESFTIASDAFRNLGLGDCELVEEFTRQILPKFVTRRVTRDITCVPFQASGSRFLVRGEILKPLPRAEQAAGRRDAMEP